MARINFISDPLDKSWVSFLPKLKYTREIGPKDNKTSLVSNLIASFDIETTNTTHTDGTELVLKYSHQFILYNLETQKHTFFLFRTSEELRDFFNYTLPEALDLKPRAYVYTAIHNAGFEFRNTVDSYHIDDEEVFFNGSSTRVLRYRTDVLEFRDTYQLYPVKLEVIGEELGIPKGKDFDYSLERNPNTPLSDDEVSYAFKDVFILCKFIEEKLKDERDISYLPYTQTGYVRRETKRVMSSKEAKGDLAQLRKQTLTLNQYLASRASYYGGYTQANILHLGDVVEKVTAFDVASMYPYQMVAKMFPMGPVKEVSIKDVDMIRKMSTTHCIWGTYRFENLRTNHPAPSIYNKAEWQEQEGIVLDGQKVRRAKSITLSLTEIDLFRALEIYDFDELYIVGDVYVSEKGYLPTELVKYIIELYYNKTAYKGLPDKKQTYDLSKMLINSLYGMTATDIVRPMIMWSSIDYEATYERLTDEMMEEQLEDYNGSRRYISALWGFYVTAYARQTLFEMIDLLGDDYVYCDTDSVYFTGDHLDLVKSINDRVEKELQGIMPIHGLDKQAYTPTDPNGIRRPLGIWSEDGYNTRFKTLGAKSYLKEYETENGPEMQLTHSGLPKTVIDYINSPVEIDGTPKKTGFDFFDYDFYVPKEHTNKLGKKLINEYKEGVHTDYLGNSYDYNEQIGVYLYPVDYNSTVRDLYIQLSKEIKKVYKTS